MTATITESSEVVTVKAVHDNFIVYYLPEPIQLFGAIWLRVGIISTSKVILNGSKIIQQKLF
tara:strand:- start:27051 stop:27236 length:186 start_codon:yes stop_codon:yes gene_type:complete